MKNIILVTLIALSGIGFAQDIHVPIVLTQRLPWAPATINVGGTCSIDVILDTVDFVDIVTSGTVDEVEKMDYPAGMITLDEASKRLTIDKNIPYKNGIRIHTSSKDITVNAREYSGVSLRSASGDKTILDHLVLRTENLAIIDVKTPIDAAESNIDSKDYSWIRYNLISSSRKYITVKGNGRVVEIGETSDRVDESAYGLLFQRDHQQIPIFMEYTFGSSILGSSPFYSPYVKGNNFIWSSTMISNFNYQFRYAFWSTNNWSLSAGFGVNVESYRVDNAYVDLIFDTLSSMYSLQAMNTSNLFASEEQTNGKIYWNSNIMGVCYITIPVRLEWRNRADYRGCRIGAEFQPSVAISRSNVAVRRYGFYADKNMVGSTKNDKIGKLINPFRLDLRLTASYGRFGVFAQTSLTPLFRTSTDNPVSKPALNQKLHSSSIGITFTF